MKKLTFGLLVALSTTVALSGCALYFGDDHHHGGDTWTYCGSDGYYTCQGDNCQWAGATCPPDQGAGSGSGSSGYECKTNADCAAGCYCANGKCEEAGFCTQDSDCGEGYVCDVMRSSCEPAPPKATCDYDSQCPQGQYCAADHTCTASCVCTTDEQAVANGFGWCDESRSTCLPGQDPAGTCGGNALTTCTMAQPTCAAGQVATLIDGCFTGQCRDIASCDVDPVCTHITDQASCDSRSDCAEVVNGINCHKTDGTACHAGDAGCTCDSYVFASCRSASAP